MKRGTIRRAVLCLLLVLTTVFLASCGLVSVETTAGNTDAKKTTGTTATEPDKTVIPDWTTDGETYPDTGVKCYFEVKETGASSRPGVTYAYLADGKAAANGTTYPQYTFIHVETGESEFVTFVGWSVGKPLREGEEPISTELGYSFRLTETTYLYANFKETYPAKTTMVYHLNGGTANGEDVVTDTVDTSFFTAPNTRYDDGSFTREGYVLLEYNTEPDGTGDAYSPGSKANAVNGSIDLYCIWAEASTGFSTATDSYKVSWKETYSGVAITGWSGDDETLVIPETIDGKNVVSIKAGAITNKSFTTLVLPRTLRVIEDGAFVGCSSLKTLYMGDGILSISNDAFDEATYANWSEFRLSATTAPRYAASYDGGYRVKWDRLMRGVASGKKMIVFVSGSSSLHGISTEYLEKLLDEEYFVVEYGTIRTTNNMVYMEAIANFVGEGDIVVYAPENSIYQFGCPTLTWKLFRDLESSQNVWRYIDVRNYDNLFGAFAEYQSDRWSKSKGSYSDHHSSFDRNGDFQNAEHKGYCLGYGSTNHGYFTVTLNDKVNSITTKTSEISLDNPTQWIDIGTYASDVRRILGKVTDAGATVYFGFCPVTENALTANARTPAQQAAFDNLIAETFGFELLGSCSDHLYDWIYMYKGDDGSDFHLNDYGRAINTYTMYTHLCRKLGLTAKAMQDYKQLGLTQIGESRERKTDYAGCLFEFD
ncbi:MAG: leucine-rich repeat protein [Clostridia bacterium]|nr:leucine-rich repeat protein [Clostridia bacterium]